MQRDPQQSHEGSHPQPSNLGPGEASSTNRPHQLQSGGDRDPELYGSGSHSQGLDHPQSSATAAAPAETASPTPTPCDDPYYCDSDHQNLYHDMLTDHQRNGIRGPAQLRALFRREVESGGDEELRKTLLDNGPLMCHYGWITEAFLGEMGGSMLSGDEEEEEEDGGVGVIIVIRRIRLRVGFMGEGRG
ncbi:hypothetical protein G7Y79_00002g008260 [Physcia stellaris]|nr:hypothetical protein G7Y79_00002g008260 [Physcia stellaris]